VILCLRKLRRNSPILKLKKVVLGSLGGSVVALDSAVNAFAAEPATLSSALSDGVSILEVGYTFITGHAILFSICALGLVVGAVKVIRRMI